MTLATRDTTTFFPHQERGIRAAATGLLRHGGFYLQHDPGMGKTREAVSVAQLLGCKRVVIVTTKAGLSVWPQEITRWWPEGSHSYKLINYDRLNAANVAILSGEGIDLLILDESHYVKNYKSLRSKAVANLRKRAAKVLLLSGTPAHSPLDYWNQYRLIAPSERPWCLNYVQYRDLVANLAGPHRNWIKGFKSAEVAKVEAEMALYTDKAVIEELELPEPIETIYPVNLSAQERLAYRRMQTELHYEIDGKIVDAPIILTKILRLQQITAGFVRPTDGNDVTLGSSKSDAVMDILEERAEQKIVVAYRFDWEARSLEARLKYAKRPYDIIDGSVSSAMRTRIIADFQNKHEPTVLLLQEDAGGTSVTLTAAAAMIFTTLPSSVINFEQVKARIHRIGTVTSKQYIFLQAVGTIDGALLEGLRAKADLVALLSLLRRSL